MEEYMFQKKRQPVVTNSTANYLGAALGFMVVGALTTLGSMAIHGVKDAITSIREKRAAAKAAA
jgi:hypothetical protein